MHAIQLKGGTAKSIIELSGLLLSAGCPGPGNSFGFNPAVPPASKEAESPSNLVLFCSVQLAVFDCGPDLPKSGIGCLVVFYSRTLYLMYSLGPQEFQPRNQ